MIERLARIKEIEKRYDVEIQTHSWEDNRHIYAHAPAQMSGREELQAEIEKDNWVLVLPRPEECIDDPENWMDFVDGESAEALKQAAEYIEEEKVRQDQKAQKMQSMEIPSVYDQAPNAVQQKVFKGWLKGYAIAMAVFAIVVRLAAGESNFIIGFCILAVPLFLEMLGRVLSCGGQGVKISAGGISVLNKETKKQWKKYSLDDVGFFDIGWYTKGSRHSSSKRKWQRLELADTAVTGVVKLKLFDKASQLLVTVEVLGVTPGLVLHKLGVNQMGKG